MAVPGRAQTFSTVPTLPKRVAKFCHCLQSSLARELANAIEGRRSFPAVLTKEADIKPDSKVVRLENTIIQYTRGSSTARYMVGFGAGMPRVRVRGKMTEWGGAKPLCLFEIERAGDWFGSGFTSSKTLQTGTFTRRNHSARVGS